MRDLCRTCGAILLNSVVKNLFNDNELVAFVQYISGTQIKNEEKLPVNICNVCHKMLNEMISFKKRCILVQNFFNFKIWKEHKLKEASKSTAQDSNEEVIYEGESDNQIATTENSYLDELELHDDDIESDSEYNSIQDEEMKEIQVKKKTKSHVRNRWERKWICEICGKMSTSSSNLKQHQSTHNAVKAFKCNSCDKAFHFSYELKKHELTHTENHPFVCSFCSAKFTHASGKIRHEKIHTNTRPHKCSYCEKSFVGKTSLRNHETTHTRIRKYHCEICGHWAFTQKQLKLHNKSKTHKRNEYEHNLRLQKNMLEDLK